MPTLSPDGQYLAISHYDMSDQDLLPHIWQLNPLRHITSLAGHSRAVAITLFSPNGHWVATGSHDGTTRLWRTDTWELAEHGILRGHKRGVFDLGFSADGRTLASAADDGTIKLWNVGTGALLLSLTVDTVPWLVQFAPDGKTLIVHSDVPPVSFNRVEEIRVFRAPSLEELGADTP